MKRLPVLFLIFALLLSGCGSTSAPNRPSSHAQETAASVVLEAILPAAPESAETLELVAEEDLAVFLEIYGLSPEQAEDCAIARMGGARVFEIAVLRCADGEAEAVAEALNAYLAGRQGDFTGYAPDQAALAEEGSVLICGDWAALIISQDADSVAEAFALSLGGSAVATGSPGPSPAATPSETPSGTEPSPEPAPTPEPTPEPSPEPTFELPRGWREYVPPGIDDMTIYDTSAILAAWESGSPGELDQRDKELYNRCREIIDALITEGMTDYEKEWAVYSWLVTNVSYDWRHNDPAQTAPRASFQPYGAIVRETAVCLGFATAFQLFMDLLEVECITVVGAAFHSSGDHAWNMVKLNGEWYCVDATWDLGRGRSPESCGYFNVTSDHMARTDHQWDYENTPMATATDGGK